MDKKEILRLFKFSELSIEDFGLMYGEEYMKVALSTQKRGIRKEALRYYDLGWSAEDIAAATGSTLGYIKNILPSAIDDSVRDRVLQLRYMGWSMQKIAAEVGLKIGSVQNYLRPVKKCIVREDVETGFKKYFVSIPHVLKYHPELSRKKLIGIIQGKDAWSLYKFYWEYNVNLLEKI